MISLLSAYFESWNAKLDERVSHILLMDDIYWGVKSVSSPTLSMAEMTIRRVGEGGMGDFEVIIFS